MSNDNGNNPTQANPFNPILGSRERYEKMLNLSLKITDDYNSSRRLDIEQMRSLLVQISVISFGAVGFSIPIIGTSSIVQNKTIFSTGLLFLSLSALFGIWYTGIIIENSIINSYKGFRRSKNEVRRSIANEVFLMKNPNKVDRYLDRLEHEIKILKKSSKLKFKRDSYLYVLLSLLSVGILCIFISLFKVSLSISF